MPAITPEHIHALIAAAINADDLDAFMELHEEEATALVPPDRQAVSGRHAIAAAAAPAIRDMTGFEVEVAEKLQAGDLAMTHAFWHAVGIAGGKPVEMSGRGTVVSRRQPDGTWRIVLDNPMSPS